ncbi:uncharacterized protein MELLADRAFT_103421 [Melampsora larici-populina 98AG31]|uniref:Ribosomal protein S15 n=1 Tax=Melampsora larici-populina (strain 98AG31 / pathotype 3-4-7) TaxID=747676 RepID=F4RBE8_MELLP|nr:uncharacterized protein MELLADRAFT_103421 [Melampsora larici-populina 98AG31]EGG10071.1 hypothetical protein MELLADRAFT_103421 [Melampsora larici-populina 98AG31]
MSSSIVLHVTNLPNVSSKEAYGPYVARLTINLTLFEAPIQAISNQRTTPIIINNPIQIQSSYFSTSIINLVKTKSQKKEIKRQKTKAYESLKEQKQINLQKEKPDPILGYSTSKPKDYLTWENCELNQLILKNEDVWSGKLGEGEQVDQIPNLLNFGLTDDHKELLFKALPLVSSQKSILDVTNFESVQQQRQDKSISEESLKQKALTRILDLRNADSKAIDKVNKSRIIKAFSPKPTLDEEQKLDPGCAEVQAAIATYRIHAVLKHAWSNTRDVHSRRHLTQLVMHRMKTLKNLRNNAPNRYRELLPRIGLQPRYLTEELIIRSKLPLKPGELAH